jgi:flagellar biosynthesis chaperone FliJ
MAEKEFENVNDALRHMMRVVSEIRGEAIAGQMLAMVAVDILLVQSSDRSAFIDQLEKRLDQQLNQLQPAGESTPEFDAVARETARSQVYALLDTLRRGRA